MKRIFKSLYSIFATGMVLAALSSCSMDEPMGNHGEGYLCLTTEIKGDVIKTRAMSSDELASLNDKCIVYIENNKGVIRKYRGLQNLPEQIRLATGDYVAEAWSGDSVSASFNSKFYRGYQNFRIEKGSNSLTLRCNIANVIVSVDPASLDVNLNNLKVTVSHSRGELVFDQTNIADSKGYFMMPNADKDLSYKIEGERLTGEPFVKEGVIANVQRAHEYVMKITEDESEITEGGALIKLIIEDIPVLEEEVEVFTAPAFKGIGFDLENQVVSTKREFNDTRLYIRGYFGLSSVIMKLSDNFTNLPTNCNILEGSIVSELKNKGILVERVTSEDASTTLAGGKVTVDELYVTFTSSFLNNLPDSNNEYAVTFDATDERHLLQSAVLRFANTEDAIERVAPVGAYDAPDPVNNPMAVLARSATLHAAVYDVSSANNPGIRYRVQGTSQWSEAYPATNPLGKATRAESIPYTVTLTGLTPATTYEYVAFCDGFQSDDIKVFTTETPWVIPNASFEEWSTYQASTLLGTKTVILPGAGGDKNLSYWGSGNEGGATANKILTDKSTEMLHSGTYSARLESQTAVGVLAAGNLFVGTYVKTDGTDGVLSLGRQYNSSHPEKLTFWANYRPGSSVKVKGGNESFVPEGFASGKDHGQVYVALTTEPVEIRTKASDRKLFDVNDPTVLAYGQVTWTDNIGPDGALVKVEIPLKYKEAAKSQKAYYLVIVASASKYGDYFSGSGGSLMYLDDFQLEY